MPGCAAVRRAAVAAAVVYGGMEDRRFGGMRVVSFDQESPRSMLLAGHGKPLWSSCGLGMRRVHSEAVDGPSDPFGLSATNQHQCLPLQTPQRDRHSRSRATRSSSPLPTAQ